MTRYLDYCSIVTKTQYSIESTFKIFEEPYQDSMFMFIANASRRCINFQKTSRYVLVFVLVVFLAGRDVEQLLTTLNGHLTNASIESLL